MNIKSVIKTLVILVVGIAIGYFLIGVVVPNKASSRQPSIELIENARYELEGGIQQYTKQRVADGQYTFTFQQGKAGALETVKGSLTVDTENAVFGDYVSYQWNDITVVPTIENYGGSGQYVRLQVLQGPYARFVSSLPMGDRTEIISIEIRDPYPKSEKYKNTPVIVVKYNAKYPLSFEHFTDRYRAGEGELWLTISQSGKLYPFSPEG